jgi:FlaA1/EpsC-like NDP-sugar epimerase
MPETSSQPDLSPDRPSLWLETFALRHRLVVNVVIHAILFALALLLAYLVRYDLTRDQSAGGWFMDRYVPGVKLLRGGWQYASIRDVANILLASWLFVFITFVLILVFEKLPQLYDRRVPIVGDFFKTYPKSVLFLDFLATVFLVCAARLAFRLYREELRPVASEGIRRVLIVGAGNAAETVIREIHRMQVERYRVVGLVDDDPSKKGMFIHGIPVLGLTEDIRDICEEEEIDEIIIAVPSATQKQLRHIIELCSGTQLKFQSLPSMGDLIDGRVTVSQIRPVDINDLLGREVVKLDKDAIANLLSRRRVVITGAGGSIGSEMARQICAFGPAHLILVEQAETPLFDIENELRRDHPQLPITPVICDIYDRTRVMKVWDEHRPEVVIHAAAHKHVPMMERNPCEAVKNNILGTRNVADASCRYDTDEFVMISTDKAVNPSSVMGASKRVAEMYTQALNGSAGCRTQFKAVRFGNVLGSAGSVVPTFRRQIAAGGPVTVTHPEMTRYFMTIPEAAQLVLQAAATGSGGEVYLLDMGEPVKIVDLARQMITLSGFRPGEDIDIVFTGVRPGEKLFEELRTAGEDIAPTVHPKVMIWKHRPVEWPFISAAMERFEALANEPTRGPVVEGLQQTIPEYEPLNPPTPTGPRPSADDSVAGAVAGKNARKS